MSCLIEIDNLSYRYPDGVVALRDINLHIKHGETVGLVGPNGAGKTTLFLILAGVIENFDGSVKVAGCDLTTKEGRRDVHQKLGIVFQNADDQLFNPTVYEDIAFGPLNLGIPKDEIPARVDQAMQMVGLDSSLKTRVPFHLSGGEKRRVALAGILAMQPNVLLLDEPSSDLDPRGRRELLEIIKAFPITRIVSSHDLCFILECCERVVVCNDGTIQAKGDVRDILSDEELMMSNGLEVPFPLQK